MKICYLNHDLKENTGAGRFCLFLIKEIKDIFPESKMTVLTSESSGHSLEKSLIKAGFLGFLFSFFKVRRVFKESDIVHALDGWPYGFWAVAASLGLKKKIIITAVGSGAVAPLYSWRKHLLIWAYKKAPKLTAISRNTKKEILKIAPNLEIKVINHGVDFEKFKNTRPVSVFDKLKPYILTICALKPRKGLEYSLKAFAQIATDFKELKYVIFGTDNSPGKTEEKRLKNISRELGIAEKVIFLSQKITDEELSSLYHNAELFILLPQDVNDVNKDIEGFGLVFLEAAACGLPVVSASGTSAEDAVLNGQNGLLVPPQDFAAAGEAMAKILGDPNKREAFSKASVELAQKMTWRKTATQYAELYKNI